MLSYSLFERGEGDEAFRGRGFVFAADFVGAGEGLLGSWWMGFDGCHREGRRL